MASERPNPYVGTRPFEEEDSEFFFGRRKESRQLTSLIIAQRAVLFYAQSGAGKTSLLQASVIPRLKERKQMVVLPIARVAGDLPHGVDPGQVTNIYAFNALSSLAGAGASPGDLVDVSLEEGLASHLAPQPDERRPRPRLLILDQFEELFTTHPGRYTERADFFRQLQAALATYPQLTLLLSMREDFVAHLDPYAGRMPDRLRTRYRMERMGVTGALAAVKRPTENTGCRYGDGVAERLVDNLRRIKVQPPAGGVEETALGPFIETVQLQVVCSQLWENARRRSEEVISDRYLDASVIDEALIAFYEAAIEEAERRTDVSQESLRDWVQHELITEAGTRGTAFRGDQFTGEIRSSAADILVDKYLLRTEARAGGTWYELIHDRFVEPILESNRRVTDAVGFFRLGGGKELARSYAATSKVVLDAMRDVVMTLDSWGQANLEVRTYISRDPNSVTVDPKSGELLMADLQALTSIGLDGDSSVMLPLDDSGAIDDGLWQIHQALVDQALASRTEFVSKLVQIADTMEQGLARR